MQRSKNCDSWGEKSIKSNPEWTEMLELTDKDTKTVITMFRMFKRLSRHGQYKKKKSKDYTPCGIYSENAMII